MLGDKFGRSDVIEIFPRKIGSYIFPRKYEKRLKNVCFNIIDNRVHAIDNNDVHLTHYFDPIQGNKTLLSRHVVNESNKSVIQDIFLHYTYIFSSPQFLKPFKDYLIFYIK